MEAVALAGFDDQFKSVIPAELNKEKVDSILAAFKEDVSLDQEVFDRAMGIVVTDDSQTDLMNQARELRLALKNDRVRIEKTRKALKEQSLREGQLIDGIARILKAKIEPTEAHLEAQEKFAELREAERKAALAESRSAELAAVNYDITGLNLGAMPDETYQSLLEAATAADHQRKEDERLAEEARIKEERERSEREAALREENERLRAEKELADKKANEEAANRKRLEEESARREAEINAEAARKAEEERRAALAPEKEKVQKYIADLKAITQPDVHSPEATAFLLSVSVQLDRYEAQTKAL